MVDNNQDIKNLGPLIKFMGIVYSDRVRFVIERKNKPKYFFTCFAVF